MSFSSMSAFVIFLALILLLRAHYERMAVAVPRLGQAVS
jgi:sulfite exporter TauE/SafE